MARQRSRANMFLSSLSPYTSREYFGGLKQRDLVDALILQHEADRLGIPATPEVGRQWLSARTGGRMDAELFNSLYSRFSNDVSEEHLLSDIANQARLLKVRLLQGYPVVTPYDVFRSYRDQNERIGAKLVEVPVDSFLDKVGEPLPEEVQELYDRYKDRLPDPTRETPGFKIHRQVQLEILSIDGTALARGIRDKLTEAELRSYYENHRAEFEVPLELPRDLFADQPELTPPIIQPFADVRTILAPRLAEEKAQAEMTEKFTKVKEDELIPFAEEYLGVLDELEDAKKSGPTDRPQVSLPTPKDLKPLADRSGMVYEKTGLLSREAAERYGPIATAEVGLNVQNGGRKFVDEVFDPKTELFEPVELTDILGTRFLVRKIADQPPRVPSLDEVRSEVIVAWKKAKARPLAAKAADNLAKQIKAKGSPLKDARFENYRVATIPPITRYHTSFLPTSMFEPSAPIESQIPDVPNPGDAFRNAYFSLQPGAVEVVSNQPKSVYYVITPDRHEPAKFTALYAPNGDEFRYKNIVREQALRKQDQEWMSWLRKQAGLKEDWVPSDEAKKLEPANS
jgi:peptidyl-prolyl cis-trans isomerase D